MSKIEDASESPVSGPRDYFEVVAEDSQYSARAATIKTAHGRIDTPCFMPVGTYGAVKGLIPNELWDCGSQIILGNAYHLGHRPGAERIAQMGGLHGMMAWSGPILTDSGGYQVFSLRGLQKIDDEGVDYRTHFDGQKSRMTPRSVLEVQAALGSDICMILDHCPPGDASPEAMREAMDRTTRWAQAASDMRREILGAGQLCFGIVQGGCDESLRKSHLEAIAAMDFDGIALGGLSVGEPIPEMHRIFRSIAPQMPKERPRYVMGIGTPHDLLEAVCAGVDIFDCVMPTRHARNGQLFTWEGKINLRRAEFRHDLRPVDAKCGCLTCKTFSRAYLRHLHDNNDPLYTRLATLHNLTFYHDWVGGLRGALRRGDFPAQVQRYRQILERGYGV